MRSGAESTNVDKLQPHKNTTSQRDGATRLFGIT